jgi:hypothetical protein
VAKAGDSSEPRRKAASAVGNRTRVTASEDVIVDISVCVCVTMHCKV